MRSRVLLSTLRLSFLFFSRFGRRLTSTAVPERRRSSLAVRRKTLGAGCERSAGGPKALQPLPRALEVLRSSLLFSNCTKEGTGQGPRSAGAAGGGDGGRKASFSIAVGGRGGRKVVPSTAGGGHGGQRSFSSSPELDVSSKSEPKTSFKKRFVSLCLSKRTRSRSLSTSHRQKSKAQMSATDTKGTEGGKTTNPKVTSSVTLNDARLEDHLPMKSWNKSRNNQEPK